MTLALDKGFQDIVVLVRDAKDTAKRLQESLGYEILASGAVDPAALELLGADPSWKADEILIGDPAQGRGYIRLIDFPQQDLPLGRDGAQPWDTGGIFDFNIRTLRSIEDVHGQMTRRSFVGYTPITHWQFGPLDVKEVVLRDGDGLCIALMQRLAPPLTGFDAVTGSVSYVFNSTQVVPDFKAARSFYVDVLGWQVVQESIMQQDTGENCVGLPFDVARETKIEIGIYHPLGAMEGSVEIISFDLEGRDYNRAPVPARGIASVRFPVSNPAEILGRAKQAGCDTYDMRAVHVAPYGVVEMGALVTAWGARLEFYKLP